MLLVATGVLNYFLNLNNAPKDDDDIVAPTFFASYREDRETTRAEEILYLDNSIITSAEADEETIAKHSKRNSLFATLWKLNLYWRG